MYVVKESGQFSSIKRDCAKVGRFGFVNDSFVNCI